MANMIKLQLFYNVTKLYGHALSSGVAMGSTTSAKFLVRWNISLNVDNMDTEN